MYFFHLFSKATKKPPRLKREHQDSQNKITSEVKDKLQLLIDDLIASLNVNDRR